MQQAALTVNDRPPSPISDRIDPVPAARKATTAPPSIARWSRLRSHKWLAVGIVVFLGLVIWQGYRFARGPLISVDLVARHDLVETIVASGNVQAPFRVNISSQIAGVVADVLVEEGARVEKGQKLVQLDSNELEAQRAQAEGALAQARARMRQLQELILPTAREMFDQARATELDAEHTYDRTSALFKNGYVAKSTLDNNQKNLDVARTQVRAAQLQVYTSSPGGSDYVMAETQLKQALANLDVASSRLNYAAITAPRDGVLISRNVERGTVVQPGMTLLTLSPSGAIQLVLDIDEKNLANLAIGQHALASADAYPNQRFDAVVTYINPGIDISRASVVVKLDVPHPPPYLVQDMTVSVDIEVAKRDGALTVPRRDIHDLLGKDPWVLIETKGHALTRSVKVGLVGDNDIEIVAGLAEGDLVIPTTTNIVSGDRIRATRP